MIFEGALRETGYLYRQTLIWVKNTLVLGRSDYQYKHEPILELENLEGAIDPLEPSSPAADVSRETTEPAPGEPVLDAAALAAVDGDAEPLQHAPVLYGFTPGVKGAGRLGRGGEQWYGGNKQTTVFEFPKPAASREHPTMKPTDLIVAQLRNSTVRGQLVLDHCAGSGSTLIAAHRIGLVAALVELEPDYCDVICRRWQEFSGVMPILERTGEAVDFVPKGA
jgi:site-specific DNA-methyltransferase (adenine-specific)